MSGINIEINQEGTNITIKLLPESARSIKLSADQLLRLIQQLESYYRELKKGLAPCPKRPWITWIGDARGGVGTIRHERRAVLPAAPDADRAPRARGAPRRQS